jgi:hypothetical protein
MDPDTWYEECPGCGGSGCQRRGLFVYICAVCEALGYVRHDC